jgi:TetR/AcrR family transcriptional repressor of nem operon
MPWPSQKKQESHERILRSAVRLFSSRGFDSVSIRDVMQEAGLSHGGFYAHFDSKQELYAEAVVAAARESAIAEATSAHGRGDRLLERILAGYLDVAHVRQEHSPCPLAFLATDIANREAEVRGAYTQVFKRMVALLHTLSPSELPQRRQRALALAAMMVGGVAISRALDDERLIATLLRACRELGDELMSPPQDQADPTSSAATRD